MLESVQKLVLVWLTIFSLVYSQWKCYHSSSCCNNYQLRRYINTCRRRKLLSSLSLLSSSSSLSSSLTLSSNPTSTIDWENYKQPENVEFPTDEQKNIIEAACTKNCNIIVNAVAGSGKTTTISNIANACKDQSILALTYNRQLKVETKKKCDTLENIVVYNFHSLILHKYSECGKDGKGMEKVIRTAKQPTEPFSYDIIIIDEIQDMTLYLYKFLFKILKDNLQKEFRIIVLGNYHHHHHHPLSSSSSSSPSPIPSSSQSLALFSIISILNTVIIITIITVIYIIVVQHSVKLSLSSYRILHYCSSMYSSNEAFYDTCVM